MLEQKGKYFYENVHLKQSHEIVDTVNCFSNIDIEYHSLFPIKIKTKPCIIVLERKIEHLTPFKRGNHAVDVHINSNQFETDTKTRDLDTSIDTIKSGEIDIMKTSEIVLDDLNERELKKPSKPIRPDKSKLPPTESVHKQAEMTPNHMPSAKKNIRNIIKSEKIREIAEKISHLDLKNVCNLNDDSVKSCLWKIFDDYIES